MIKSFRGKTPKIHETAFISKQAYIVGDVEIGEGAGIWPGTVIRGDSAKIVIGKNTQIEDNCTVHSGVPMTIGENVLIGHNVVVHCARIGDNVLIGNNATLLDNAEIGQYSVVGANALVNMGMKVPERTLAFGVPAKITSEVPEERTKIIGLALLMNAMLAKEYKEHGL
ncbi:MAG: gamma carbonic anhydrase family protein [Dehalococcoidia bacterium]|nr:gamma carbonic anhydrase family protein [Dehalococcoidia bacterium]